LSGFADAPAVSDLLAEINAQFDHVDLSTGPLSILHLDLPGGLGFDVQGGQYVRTGPGWPDGDVKVWHEGADLAVDFVRVGRGGSRFLYSAVPRSSVSVVGSLYNRVRGNGQDFDVGLIVNGATVN